MKKLLALLLPLLPTLGLGQEISSVRQGTYDWECQRADGTRVSGHTRQDKAFQSCFNEALSTSEDTYVVGGRYRVSVTGAPTTPPPVEPLPPDPEPEPEPPPTEGPLLTLGPIDMIIEYPNLSAFEQDSFHWVARVTFNNDDPSIRQGIVSRDESGQADAGHLSIWWDADQIRVRNQDISGGGPATSLAAPLDPVIGQEYEITLSMSANGIGLFIDGALVDSNPVAYGLTGNTLPLVLCGNRSRVSATAPNPDNPFDGTCALEIWDDPLELPTPIVGSATLQWVPPTEDVENQPLPIGMPDRFSVYSMNPRTLIVSVDGEDTDYEVSNLSAGTHCFVVTAWAETLESDDSNQGCKTIQ
jgi:hypothetical protein